MEMEMEMEIGMESEMELELEASLHCIWAMMDGLEWEGIADALAALQRLVGKVAAGMCGTGGGGGGASSATAAATAESRSSYTRLHPLCRKLMPTFGNGKCALYVVLFSFI